jgi:hypothetical protein
MGGVENNGGVPLFETASRIIGGSSAQSWTLWLRSAYAICSSTYQDAGLAFIAVGAGRATRNQMAASFVASLGRRSRAPVALTSGYGEGALLAAA